MKILNVSFHFSTAERASEPQQETESELAKILNRRSRHLEDWEAQLAAAEAEKKEAIQTEADKSIAEYEQKLEEEKQNRYQKKEPEVVDTQLLSVLEQRRKKHDEPVDIEKDPRFKPPEPVKEVPKPVQTSQSKTPSQQTTPTWQKSTLTPQQNTGGLNKHGGSCEMLNASLKIARTSSPLSESSVPSTPASGSSAIARKKQRPLLRKAKTFDAPETKIDPELESVLKSRRQKDADEENEEIKYVHHFS